MAGIRLRHIYKVYENGVKAVSDFNIDIEDKEFIVFVGPSGCGKSTTLRMIAGLEKISSGDLYIGDRIVNSLEPKYRDIAMVFQNYALYPHMSVYENMAFCLRNAHVEKKEIDRRVKEAAKILDLEDYLDRKPKAMSGGQRQRVALGRAIVRNPKVFLLDEPLSNLDAKLRAQMRTEITKLHKQLQTTFIYVTHDQVEAMTMGTRIVVMKDGLVQQIDTPLNLYNKPKNKFVAGFIGTPQMNFFDVTLKRDGEHLVVTFEDGSEIRFLRSSFLKLDVSYLDGIQKAVLGVRPDRLRIAESGLAATIVNIERLGNETLLYLNAASSGTSSVAVKVPADFSGSVGDRVHLVFDADSVHLFDRESERSLLNEIPLFSRITGEIKGSRLLLFGNETPLPPRYRGLSGPIRLSIPPESYRKGDDYRLKVLAEEAIGKDEVLLTLDNDGDPFFLRVEKDTEIGPSFAFSLRYDRIALEDEKGASGIEPMPEKQSLQGKIEEEKVVEGGRKYRTYFYAFGAEQIPASLNKVIKIHQMMGKKFKKEKFRFEIPTSAIALSEEGIPATVKEVFDYGDRNYLKVSLNGIDLFVIGEATVGETVRLCFDSQAIDIYNQEEVRLC